MNPRNLFQLGGPDWLFAQRRKEPPATPETQPNGFYYDTEYNRLLPRSIAAPAASREPSFESLAVSELNWRPCSVPGSVQTALMENGEGREPIFKGLNIQSLQTATVHKETFFRKTFTPPPGWRGKAVTLFFTAVDYDAEVFLNGRYLGNHLGHYTPFSFEVGDVLSYDGENTLMVRLAPFPEERSRSARSQILKNQVSDCTPAVCPLGISDEVFLRACDRVALDDLWVRSHLAPTLDKAELQISVTLDGKTEQPIEALAEIAVYSDEGIRIASASKSGRIAQGKQTWLVLVEIENPDLWWPNGLGGQPLYNATVRLTDAASTELDSRSQSFGIRKIELAPNEGAEHLPFPWVAVVNGQKVYLKGGGWPPMDCFYRNDPARHTHFLTHAQAAHLNCIRWWGGGIPEPSLFYRRCDELGLMVIHDFFMANENFDTPEFLKRIMEDCEGFVRARRNHPSILMWNGGNELNYRYAKSAIAQATAAALMAKHDPDRPVVPCTPCVDCGQTHSITPYNYSPEHDYERAIQSPEVLAMEGNCAAIANESCLRKIIPEAELVAFRPEDPSASFLQHNILANWGGSRWNWLGHETTNRLFGGIASLSAYVDASQYSRAECLAFGLEEYRRGKFFRSGTVVWQLVESWPNAAGNALIDWYGLPKPSYYYVKRAFSPIAASLRFTRILWTPGETWSAELWLADDTLESFSGSVEWEIVGLDGTLFQRTCREAHVPENASRQIGNLAWEIPPDHHAPFVVLLSLRKNGSEIACQQYLHSSKNGNDYPFSPVIALEPAAVEIERLEPASGHSLKVAIRNKGANLVFGARLAFDMADSEESHPTPIFSDNHFHLPPGRERIVSIDGAEPFDRRRVIFSALNVPPISLK